MDTFLKKKIEKGAITGKRQMLNTSSKRQAGEFGKVQDSQYLTCMHQSLYAAVPPGNHFKYGKDRKVIGHSQRGFMKGNLCFSNMVGSSDEMASALYRCHLS